MSDSKSLSQQRYSQYAAGYVTSQTHAKGDDLGRLLEIAQPQPHWVALDVATGGGHTALKFAPHVARMVATDLTPAMLEQASAFISGQGADNVEYRVADAENLPFEARSFDLVTCRIAPHHFPDAERFVHECARVLKPGGLLLVQDHVLPEDETAARYADEFEKRRDPSHNYAFTESQWRDMFTRAGFSIEHTEQIVKRHNFLDWAQRQGSPPDLIAELEELMRNAPPGAAEWMDVQQPGTPEASFVNHHLIIAGRRPQ